MRAFFTGSAIELEKAAASCFAVLLVAGSPFIMADFRKGASSFFKVFN